MFKFTMGVIAGWLITRQLNDWFPAIGGRTFDQQQSPQATYGLMPTGHLASGWTPPTVIIGSKAYAAPNPYFN